MRPIVAILLLATGAASSARAATCPMGPSLSGNGETSAAIAHPGHGSATSAHAKSTDNGAHDHGLLSGPDRDRPDGPDLPCSPSMACSGAATASVALAVPFGPVCAETSAGTATLPPRSISGLHVTPPPRLPV
ncbi:MAG TPA: hypothetical protein VK837_11840 [Longimicrobiales bacterium]|nr:hypothetical protein [Longimicrobiales bacterium]